MSTPGFQQHGSRAITPHGGEAIVANGPAAFPLTQRQLHAHVRAALYEDGALDDLATAACVLSTRRAHGTIIAREGGIIAGVPLAIAAFRLLDHDAAIRVDVEDGDVVAGETVIMRITGMARAILSAERVVLEFLQRLSGVATLTASYVRAVNGTRARIAGTWKTTPGLRALERHAMRAGGAHDPHRSGPLDGVLIRETHVAAADEDIALAVRRARELAPYGARIEVECRSVEQARAALAEGVDAIVSHGMSPAQVRECVALAADRATVIAAGAIPIDAAREMASAGVDYIAADALTQRAPARDLALELVGGTS
jgi:nicotinate-nucleotide pyrophosphorylase (carboxylating)